MDNGMEAVAKNLSEGTTAWDLPLAQSARESQWKHLRAWSPGTLTRSMTGLTLGSSVSELRA